MRWGGSCPTPPWASRGNHGHNQLGVTVPIPQQRCQEGPAARLGTEQDQECCSNTPGVLQALLNETHLDTKIYTPGKSSSFDLKSFALGGE